MAKVNSVLSKRLKTQASPSKKMRKLAELSSSGELSSFSGVFNIAPLNDQEQFALETLLLRYKGKHTKTSPDLEKLLTITSEVKAINNQALLLHGERIMRAKQVLKSYKEGAFSAWLVMTYGNRQTPYNFLQYYELHQALANHLREKMQELPKFAIYALASRDGPMKKKEQVIEEYDGEPKHIVLDKIRKLFPLDAKDRRKENFSDTLIATLENLLKQLDEKPVNLSGYERKRVHHLLQTIRKNTSPA